MNKIEKFLLNSVVCFGLGFGVSAYTDFRFKVINSSDGLKEAKAESEVAKEEMETCNNKLTKIQGITNE